MNGANARSQPLTSIGVSSGNGGVGKTSVAVNLAIGLARLGNRVALLDADFGLGNVDVLLGLAPERHLGHVFAGECRLEDILLEGPEGVRVIPASSGLSDLTALTPPQWRRLHEGLDALRGALDFVLVKTTSNKTFDRKNGIFWIHYRLALSKLAN